MSVWSPNYPLYEEHNTRRESFTSEGVPRTTVTLRGPYAQRKLVITDLLYKKRFWPFTWTDGDWGPTAGDLQLPVAPRVTAVTTRVAPQKYDVEKSDEVCNYNEDILYDVVYAPTQLKGTQKSGFILWAEDKFEPRTEMWSLDYRKFEWLPQGTDTKKVPMKPGEEPGLRREGGTLIRRVVGYQTIPSNLYDYQDHVNLTAYTSSQLGKTFEVGTLLFGGVTIKDYYGGYAPPNPAGTVPLDAFDITIRLEYRQGHFNNGNAGQNGWQYFYRSHCFETQDVSGWYQMGYKECSTATSPGPGQPYVPYLPVEFNTDWLFQPDPVDPGLTP